ncbi:hypothetical protein MES4922_110315 [Mesorhizobium ventifaucium]|uniref:SpoVT-AbrB domain-containing protein n=1 Tax=Mesorhizobium ventifaucium TaxID=666020 RepID=A0ABM9DEG0_9HYPH|nr:hypothetical protein MES4922_110315 [Mesorhizobium ventifaucium]
MANPERLATTVSTKGQVTLPSAIRKRRQWGAAHAFWSRTPRKASC